MYAADPRARINLGIRRRLAPLMENDLDRIELMNSLLLSMPGTPIIYYGDEIGMGDNIYLGDRNGVRTPMQWSPDRNAGFSRADPQRLYLPPIMDPVYGYEAVNVEAQAREPSSLLNWMRRMLAVRKTQPGVRARHARRSSSRATARSWPTCASTATKSILCVANLARSAQPVELDLARYRGRVPVEMLGRTAFPPIGELPYLLTLPAHGFYWFRLATRRGSAGAGTRSAWRAKSCRCWCCSTAGTACSAIAWCPGASAWRRRCARSSSRRCCRVHRDAALVRGQGREDRCASRSPITPYWNAGPVELAAHPDRRRDASRQPSTYFLPLTLVWEDGDEERLRSLGPPTLAKVRQQAAVGVLADAFADEAFCRALVEAIGSGQELPSAQGTHPLHADARLTPRSPAATSPALAIKPVPRADQQHRGGAGPAPVPESATGACAMA